MKAWVEDIRVLGWKTISLISMAFWQAAGGGGAKLKSLGYEEQCRGVKGRKHKRKLEAMDGTGKTSSDVMSSWVPRTEPLTGTPSAESRKSNDDVGWEGSEVTSTADLTDDSGLLPSAHRVAHNHPELQFQGIWWLLTLTGTGHTHGAHIYIHTGKTNT